MDADMVKPVATEEVENAHREQRGLRICFVAPTIYPLLDEKLSIEVTGGAQVQQVCLGRAFVDKGYSVHFVTQDFGQSDPCHIDEFVIHKTYRKCSGVPGFRFFYPRVPSIWRALERANADIYYVRGAGYLVALVAHFAKSRGRHAVFAVAGDANVDPRLLRLPTVRDKWLYRYGVRTIDAIIVQSMYQAELLQRNFGRTGYLIRNVWPRKSESEPVSARDIILWVAMFRDLKQPEHFVRLAASRPDLQFVMVGGPSPGCEAMFREMCNKSRCLDNLEVVGFKTLTETQTYFRRALALVNTSIHEGFPNTFLQAWAEGIPVVSYVDPDDIISIHGLGKVARDEEELPNALEEVLESRASLEPNIKAYFRDNHSPEYAADEYARIFSDLSLCQGSP